VDRSSHLPELAKNADGSVDILLRSDRPEGFREELDSNCARRGVVPHVPTLWSSRSLLQQKLARRASARNPSAPSFCSITINTRIDYVAADDTNVGFTPIVFGVWAGPRLPVFKVSERQVGVDRRILKTKKPLGCLFRCHNLTARRA